MTNRRAAILVFLVSALLYLPSIRNGFAYDDHTVIRLDERIHDLSSVELLFTLPYWSDPALGLYRPLALLTYAIDWAVAGDEAAWFHAVNVLWNAAACTLAFAFLAGFVPRTLAILGTLLFAAHPVHVEAVANVVGRAEIMAAVFSLAAMFIWLRADPLLPPTRRRIAAVAACYVLALLSKESAVMLPALLALTDMARGTLAPGRAGVWLKRNAAAILVAVAATLAFLAVRTAVLGGLGPATVDPTLDIAVTADARIFTALQAWPIILRLLVFPSVLLADYGPRIIMPALEPTAASVAGALILLGLTAGGVAAWLRGHGRAAAVLLFLPIALLPTSNLLLPIGVIVAERTLYLPSMALAMALVFTARRVWDEPAWRRGVTAGILVVTALFAVRTLIHIPVWRSTGAVFAALRRDRPDSFRAQWHFSRVAVNAGDPQLALRRYADAINMWPYRRGLALEAAAYAAQVGDVAMARRIAAFAIERWPDDVAFLRMYAGIQLDAGETAAALTTIDRALRVAPQDSVLLRMRHAAVGAER